MIDWLVHIDTLVFCFLNGTLANPVFDFIMPQLTSDWNLRVVMLVIVVYLLIFGKRKGRITAALCIFTVIATDQLSAHLIKPLVGRIRPCHVIPDVHLLVNCSAGLAFPSSHAANVYGQAAVLGSRYPRVGWTFYVFAALVSYSRVAVGVHYPGDILVGGLLGMGAGLAIVAIYRLGEKRIRRDQADRKQ